MDAEQTICGTPAYMAPEIADFRAYGKQADIWSCGVIFLEMLVGDKPYAGSSKREEGHKKK